MATKAASRKEEINGAKKAANRTKIPTLRRESNRIGRSIRYRTRAAPISASQELLMNQQKIIAGGTLLWSCTSPWAGKAARRTTHHIRKGVSKRAASKIEFGGQRTETGCGWRVSANPTFAPR